MNRRTTLLVALALAACTADLPTEPSTFVEGMPFQGVLPPVPEPPTPLSGTIPPGGGQGASIILGTYPSPTYSKVTVSGTVGYSGMETGYLPGSGSVDAGGVFVPPQGRCALQVWLLGGPVWPCTTFPQQRGDIVRYTTVHGTVTATMNAGPPGSCYNSPAPCVSYSGGIAITIEPVAARMVLKPHPPNAVAGPGGFITITAKGVTVEDTLRPVPFLPREWRWEGSGPVVGNGQTQVCAAYRINECVVRVHQSGHVVLEALVNGVVQTDRIWITVVGGDSVPPPPADTIPTDTIPTDTIPTDTLPGDCSSGGPGGLTVAACEPPDSTPPKAELRCNGDDEEATIVRGATVTCTVQLDNGGKLASVRWLADPSSKDDILPPADEGGLSPDSTSSTWSGPLILNTSVRAWVVPQDASGELQAAPVNLKVEPRLWTPWNVGTNTPGQPLSVIEFRLLDNNGHLPSPHIGSNARRRGQTLGFTAVADVDFRGERVLTAESGPNKGWSILERPYSVTSTYVYLHPDLFGGLWYAEQNGGVTRSSRLCTQRDIDGLAVVASNHEYTSGDSHLSHWNTSLASLRLQSKVESLRGFKVTEARLTTLATRLAEQTYEDIHRQEVAWDRSVYPGIYNALGCDFDNVIGDGR